MSHSAMSTPLMSAETKPSEPSELKFAYSLCQMYSIRDGSSPTNNGPSRLAAAATSALCGPLDTWPRPRIPSSVSMCRNTHG